MTVRSCQLLASGALLLVQVHSATTVWSFDDLPVGAAPPGFTFAMTRQPAAGVWSVRRTGTNGYLAHTAGGSDERGYALALVDDLKRANGRLSVRMKLVDGRRTGGIVWGYRDALNYYLVSLDLKDGALAVYRVSNGNFVRLDNEDDLELDPDAWHTVRITLDEDSARVHLGGVRVFGMRGRSYAEPGGVGLWSAGDSLSFFDDLRVEPADTVRTGASR